MTSLANKAFDLDLKFGKEGEEWLRLLADESKIEVKRERDKWVETGNIFFEYECSGNPSGIAATKSHFWAHILSVDGHANAVLLFDIFTLKENLRRLFKAGQIKKVSGGDRNASIGVLVPLRLIHELVK